MSEIQKESLLFFLFANASNFTEERRKVTIKWEQNQKKLALIYFVERK